MQRTLLYSLVLCALFGVDIVANRATVTRDVAGALVAAGRSTTDAIDGTVDFMVGRARYP